MCAFQILTAALLFHKPVDPKDFLINMLAQMKATGLEPLLSRTDVSTMFRMFDVTNRGSVSAGQAQNALRTIIGKDVKLEGEQKNSTSQLTPEKFVDAMYGTLEKVNPFTKPQT